MRMLHNPKKSGFYSQVLRSALKEPNTLWSMGGIAAVGGIFAYALPKASAWVVDTLTKSPDPSQITPQEIAVFVGALTIPTVIQSGLNMFRNSTEQMFQGRVYGRELKNHTDRVIKKDRRLHDLYSDSGLHSYIGSLSNTMGQSVRGFFQTTLGFMGWVGGATAIFTHSPKLAGMITLASLASVCAGKIIHKSLSNTYSQSHQAQAAVEKQLRETVIAQSIIRIHHAYDKQLNKFQKKYDELLSTSADIFKSNLKLQGIDNAIQLGINILTYSVAILVFIKTGKFQDYTLLTVAALQMVNATFNLGWGLTILDENKQHYNKLNKKIEATFPVPKQPPIQIDINGIQITNLDFSYFRYLEKKEDNKEIAKPKPPEFEIMEQSVLNGVSLNIGKGERVAIVGRNGSGKSTLIKLISGDYNGYIENNDSVSLSYAPQEPILTHGAIEDILRMAKSDATEDELYQILDNVGLKEKILELKDGLKFELSENGDGLSSGEKKRLSIARALLADADILIMDEPTDSLDFFNRSLVFDMAEDRTKEKTIIVVTHELDRLQGMDKIIVMNKGKVAEVGTYDTLMNDREGLFYKMRMCGQVKTAATPSITR